MTDMEAPNNNRVALPEIWLLHDRHGYALADREPGWIEQTRSFVPVGPAGGHIFGLPHKVAEGMFPGLPLGVAVQLGQTGGLVQGRVLGVEAINLPG